MRQGSDDIVAFNSKFATVAYRANLDDDADIQYYMRAIKPALRSRILNMDTVPTTIQKWQEKAALFDAHWRYNREIEKETSFSLVFAYSKFHCHLLQDYLIVSWTWVSSPCARAFLSR